MIENVKLNGFYQVPEIIVRNYAAVYFPLIARKSGRIIFNTG